MPAAQDSDILVVTPEQWEDGVEEMLSRRFTDVAPDVRSYLSPILAHPERVQVNTREMTKHQLAARGITIEEAEPQHIRVKKLQEKAAHLGTVAKSCLVLAVFYGGDKSPWLHHGRANYLTTAMLIATGEELYGLKGPRPPWVYSFIGTNFVELTDNVAYWISRRFNPQTLVKPLAETQQRYARHYD